MRLARWFLAVAWCQAVSLTHAQTLPVDPRVAEGVNRWLCGEFEGERNAPLTPVGIAEKDRPSQGVVVRVRLDFADLNAAPEVSVIYNSGKQAYADAVVRRASKYRLSCWENASAPWAGIQDFQFTPESPRPVLISYVRPALVDGPSSARCVATGDSPPSVRATLSERMGISQKERRSGAVLVKIKFLSGDSPPSTEVVASTAGSGNEKTVLDHVSGYRWLCAGQTQSSLVFSQLFVFGIDPVVTTLRQFIGLLDEASVRGPRFDFTSMNCPFEVRMTYLQPYLPNSISGTRGADNHRLAFDGWLQSVKFRPELTAGNRMVGRDLQFQAPCAILDLR